MLASCVEAVVRCIQRVRLETIGHLHMKDTLWLPIDCARIHSGYPLWITDYRQTHPQSWNTGGQPDTMPPQMSSGDFDGKLAELLGGQVLNPSLARSYTNAAIWNLQPHRGGCRSDGGWGAGGA
jgi:hypothetical protein